MTDGILLSRIVREFDAADDRDLSELPPLYDSVPVDALEALVESGVQRVEFRHAGHRIEVVNGAVSVHDERTR